MPRKICDFENNDDIYNELANHDKDNRAGRSPEVMANEAAILRRTIEK